MFRCMCFLLYATSITSELSCLTGMMLAAPNTTFVKTRRLLQVASAPPRSIVYVGTGFMLLNQ